MITIEFIEHKGEMVLVFDQPYKWISLSPTQAKQIADKLTTFVSNENAKDGNLA